MGINESKYVQKTVDQPVEETGSIPSTPILTSKVNHEEEENVIDEWDPRSPSRHIARTPIEILSAAAHKLSTLTIETTENDKPAVETPLKRHLILGIDPRSPTVGLQRTPIVISPAPDSNYTVIRNKNLEKVKNNDIQMNATSNSSTSPRLLSSNPITPKIVKSDAYKRKSFVLLETNIDYTETDLDAVIQEKYALSYEGIEKPSEVCNASTTWTKLESSVATEHSLTAVRKEDDVTDADSTEVLCPTEVSIRFNDVVENKAQFLFEAHSENIDIKEQESGTKKVDGTTDPDAMLIEPVVSDIQDKETIGKSHNVKIEEDVEPEIPERETNVEIDVVNQTELHNIDSEISVAEENKSAENINLQIENINLETPAAHLTCSKSAPVSPPNVVCTTPKQSKSEPVTPPVVNLTADVRELDKKLTNLIYEDEDPVICPRAVKPKSQCRTPLGPKNEDVNRKTAAQKLKVSDKPRKSINPGSRIPVFKDKKIKVQCENIPPKDMRHEKSKKPHWDPKDDTLVI